MKNAFAVTVTVGLAILAVLGIFLAAELQVNRVGERENQQLARRLQFLEEQLALLAEATNSLAAQWAMVRQVAASNALVAASLAQSAEPSAGVSSNSQKLQPYPVQVYVGRTAIGQGWVVPTNVRRDPKTGRVSFEQVVSLPETARGALTTYVTNTVERPVALTSSHVIEREIYRDRWAPWWGSAAVAVPSVYYGGRPERPATPDYPRPAPRPSARPVSGGPWTPVNVAPRAAPSPGLYVPPRPGDPGIFVPSGLR
jgi:hypothetical protein